MELNCHTQNAQSIVITSTKLWSWTVTLKMRNQLLLLLTNYGAELSQTECTNNCYYFDQLWWRTATLGKRKQLLLHNFD